MAFLITLWHWDGSQILYIYFKTCQTDKMTYYDIYYSTLMQQSHLDMCPAWHMFRCRYVEHYSHFWQVSWAFLTHYSHSGYSLAHTDNLGMLGKVITSIIKYGMTSLTHSWTPPCMFSQWFMTCMSTNSHWEWLLWFPRYEIIFKLEYNPVIFSYEIINQ